MLAQKDLELIAEKIRASALAGLNLMAIDLIAPEHHEWIPQLAQSIGANAAVAVSEALSDVMVAPAVDPELLKSARAAIWSQQGSQPVNTGRAGIARSWLSMLERTIAGTGDEALASLEERLLALLLATRRLRRLPAECFYEHTVNPSTGACTRCGERIEQ